jgi:hypothetical protein
MNRADRPSTLIKKRNCDLVYDCFDKSPMLVSEVCDKLKEKGIDIPKRNLFPYFEELRLQGRLDFIPGTRPRKWILADKPEHKPVDPLKEFTPELALMMGYTGIPPVGGVLIEPLEQIKEGGYGSAPRRRSRASVSIQSGLHGTIYQD